MNRILKYLPGLELEEALFIDNLLKDRNEEQLQNFANVYRTKRKDPQLILFLAIIGFMGFSGIHRFYANQIGMGILYFFTAGLCLIGTIVDMVNHKAIALESNQNIAMEISAYV